MRQTSFSDMHCDLARALDVVGDWWTPLILRDLYLGLTRFEEIAENLEISRNLLSVRLASLVEEGVVERVRYSEHPPRDRYELTESGADLVPVLMALTAWGDRWRRPSRGVPMKFHHLTCGHVFTPTVACSLCRGPLRAADVEVRPGPGGRAGRGTRLIAKKLRERAAR